MALVCYGLAPMGWGLSLFSLTCIPLGLPVTVSCSCFRVGHVDDASGRSIT